MHITPIQGSKKLFFKKVSYIYHQIRANTFKFLRKINLLKVINQLRIITCIGYLEISEFSTKNLSLKPALKIVQVSESDIPILPHCLPDQNNKKTFNSPLITKTIILDSNHKHISFRANHVVNSKGYVIGENQASRESFDDLPISRKLFSQPIRLDGVVAYLSNSHPWNYYHWMCRTLPLLSYYKEITDLKSIDYFYIGKAPSDIRQTKPSKLAKFQLETLEKLDISPYKIVQQDCLPFRSLAAISHRDKTFGDPVSKRACLFTRNLFLEECITKSKNHDLKKRIYVSRGSAARRRVVNENEVLELLTQEYGFEAVSMDQLSVQEQAQIFYESEAIVAPHGAALTNLLFARPNTKVIEVIPNGYINNCFHILSSHVEADYYCLFGEANPEEVLQEILELNIKVDIDKLKRICKLANVAR